MSAGDAPPSLVPIARAMVAKLSRLVRKPAAGTLTVTATVSVGTGSVVTRAGRRWPRRPAQHAFGRTSVTETDGVRSPPLRVTGTTRS